MPILLLRFPGRRYHATPWGHHVNEGQIEWPPSPWRLLRALIATGYATLGWPSDGPPPAARSLIEKLGSVLPHYRLPPAVGTHSRHYMPLARLKDGREETALVFDTWAQVNDGTLAVIWDATLSEEETHVLSELAGRLGYLGRSESWVRACLVGPDDSLPENDNCFPCDNEQAPGREWEQIPLMAPLTGDRYRRWRQVAIVAKLAELPTVDDTKRKLTKEEKKILERRRELEESYPLDIVACLQTRTNWLRQLGWSQPPGSERVFYWRRADTLEVGAPKVRQKIVSVPPIEVMLLSMVTASGNNHALPSVIYTLPQAELLHRALVKVACRNGGTPSKVLTGRAETGNPLTEPHRHAHLLPLDLDDDGHIEHILIWAPMLLDAAAQATVRAVRTMFTKGGVGPLRLALVGAGSLTDLRGLPGVYGEKLRDLIGPPSGTTNWISATPFVPPRYRKKRGGNTVEGQVIAELVARGYPKPIDIKILDLRENGRLLQMRHFIRSRRQGPAAPVDVGFSLALRFAEPVKGPLCLGYGCHFGLGTFRRANS
ncbi:MAG TPA: type I-U CRISPR-associated protein Csb2 [Acidiferrobacter sp.]|nr:type I-U CRISPR-associated protein Csb2 [Acidiferrobacter sp.]